MISLGVTNATALRTFVLAADELDLLRPMMTDMATMPAGAGRA